MKILVAEDEPLSRHRLRAHLERWGYEVVAVEDGEQALLMVGQSDSPRLIVLDRMMPRLDGLEVCRAVRRLSFEPYAYVILLTAQGRKQEIIEGLEAGADDYITKPFEAEELRARVRTGARIVELHEQLIAAREQLRFEATHDGLTGLLNRAAFGVALEREAAAARGGRTPLSVMMADVDYFKKINDRWGHEAGDNVLGEVARRLQRSVRASDLICRYGGEEFAVALPGCGLAEAVGFAERCRLNICREPICDADTSIAITMSFGVAAQSDDMQPRGLLRAADAALYLAKRSGRNRVESDASSTESLRSPAS